MTPAPRVSVMIAAHNRETYLPTALDSILNQTLRDLEVIVVDDGSTDRTAEVVEGYTDPRVRLLRNGTNLGIPATRNRALAAARAPYVAILDSDDYAFPRRLERQAAFLDAHPTYAEVGAWGTWMDGEGHVRRHVKQQPCRDAAIRTQLLFTACLNNRSLMGRTAVLRGHGYDESLPVCEDYDLHRRIIRGHRVANLPEVLVAGREHDAQVTRTASATSSAATRRVATAYLRDLGIEPDAAELDRHLALADPKRATVAFDRAFLAWTRAWFARLADALPAAGRHRDRVLGRLWLKAWAIAHDRGHAGLADLAPGRVGLLAHGATDRLQSAVARARRLRHLPDRIPLAGAGPP